MNLHFRLLLLLCLPTALVAEPIPPITPTLIAHSGAVAVGIANATHASFDAPAFLASGEVWFTSTTSLRESSYWVKGLWLKNNGSNKLMVRDTPGPTSTHFVFQSYDAQLLTSTQAFYTANYQSGTYGYFDISGVRTPWYQQNGGAPESGGALFESTFSTPAVNASGQFATVMLLKGTGVTGSNAAAFYVGSGDSLTLVARQGALANGFASGSYTSFYQATISSTGLASVFVSSSNYRVDGLWQGRTAEDFHQVIGGGQVAPGITNGTFSDFRDTYAVNAHSNVALLAKANSPDATTANEWGLWTNARGGLELVARTGDVAPGAAEIAVGFSGTVFAKNFRDHGSLLLNSTGHVVFNSALDNTRFDPDSNAVIPAWQNRDAGIWFWADGALQEIVIEGMITPGIPDGVVFNDLNFPRLAFNNNDLVVFTGGFGQDGFYDGTIHNDNNSGLFVWSPGAGLHLLLREGDLLEIAPGDTRAISYFNFHGSAGGGDGLPISLNDENQFVTTINFKDGSQAIYQLDLSSYAIAAVPEASTFAVIAGIGALAFAFVRRKSLR